ncbi:MAG: hypothetical protein CMK89_07965 [Pseudomonadales bacterium]|nr:hypothetical protein [Pseudomonadales bacterium]
MPIPKITLLPLVIMMFLIATALIAEEKDPPEEESDLKHLPQPAPERDETLRNQAVAAQLALTDKTTEVTWLGSGKEQFLALYLPDSSGKPFVNTLILHDNLQNPDWPGVIRSLRKELTRGGWNTLSIAVPDYQPRPAIPPLKPDQPEATGRVLEELDTEATEPEAMSEDNDEPAQTMDDRAPEDQVPEELSQRILLATQYINGKNNYPLVIIAVGSSATLLLKQAQSGSLNDVNGLVIIDPLPLPGLKDIDLEMAESDLRIPLLDIAPEFNPRSDPEPRAANARRRQQSLYQQRILRGSNRDFNGAEQRLMKTVRGWAEKLFRRQ